MNRVAAITRGTTTQTPCAACPLRRSPGFRDFSDKELDFVQRFKTGEMKVQAGTAVLVEQQSSPHIFTVLSGWGFRFKSLDDGRRQVLNYLLPGDLVGLQASILEELDHSVEALTDMTLCVFPRDGLWSLYRDHPGLGLDATWIAARQEFILDEHLVSLGRRTARERVAYLLLHLYTRAEEVGLAGDDSLPLPFTQQHFADTLGLSLVHTNKTLRALARSGLARWQNGMVKILDRKGLEAAAAYDATTCKPRPFI